MSRVHLVRARFLRRGTLATMPSTASSEIEVQLVRSRIRRWSNRRVWVSSSGMLMVRVSPPFLLASSALFGPGDVPRLVGAESLMKAVEAARPEREPCE